MILLAFLTQPFGIESESSDRVDGPAIELPLVWGQEPGPTDHLPWPNRLYDRFTPVGRLRPNFYMTRLDQVERLGRLSFPGKILARCGREWPRS